MGLESNESVGADSAGWINNPPNPIFRCQCRGSGDEDLRLSRTHEHKPFLIHISLQTIPASIHHPLTQCTMHQHGCLQDMQLFDGVVRSLVDDHQYASFEPSLYSIWHIARASGDWLESFCRQDSKGLDKMGSNVIAGNG